MNAVHQRIRHCNCRLRQALVGLGRRFCCLSPHRHTGTGLGNAISGHFPLAAVDAVDASLPTSFDKKFYGFPFERCSALVVNIGSEFSIAQRCLKTFESGIKRVPDNLSSRVMVLGIGDDGPRWLCSI